jgi:catechol 2,3-dioxygenase-like lactoylglutathione lyase family enzyme
MSGLTLDHVQIAMPVGGEAAARDFFGGLLGLDEIAKPAELAARGGCWFALGSLQLHLGIDVDFRAATKAHVALRSNVLADVQQRLTDAGHLAIADTPVDGRARFFTADPFGNRIEFIAA